MPDKVIQVAGINGLTREEVRIQQERFGKNTLKLKEGSTLTRVIWNIVREPMFLMLVIAALLYFLLGQPQEGFLMLAAMFFVAAISVYQEFKSTRALQALQQLTDPKVVVIRESTEQKITAEELVPGDVMLLEEGVKIAADAVIVQENDLTVNEAVVTGESLPVSKSATPGHDILYQGTTVNSGKCYAKVTATGNSTELGKLGKAITTFTPTKTLLQQQIERFLKLFTLFGIIGFIAIFFFNYRSNHQLFNSLLFSLTLAMSVLPEEIPVAFSSFMALGAYYMSKLGIITKQSQVIENLGAVSVICLDKTGTITENKMQVERIYVYKTDQLVELNSAAANAMDDVLWYALLASELAPFDPMEKAIWEAYEFTSSQVAGLPEKIFEYELEGQPPMMTHVYEQHGKKVIAAKGAVERIVNVCQLSKSETEKILQYTHSLAAKGCRVIGVAGAVDSGGSLPQHQDDFNWIFKGLVSLYDPPKKGISTTLQHIYDAGIAIKLLTGDYPQTSQNIASQVGINTTPGYITGEQVMNLSKNDLQKIVQTKTIFARMFPEAKLRVIDALKEDGEIVAMTGDGVNDGPALKASNIGIALGKRGTEIARQSADLILTDDNLQKIVEAIRHGRKIFNNLKKAIRYILSIHIPIILTASLPVVFAWPLPNVFTPIHIIFLELIMGPTCSIFFEREPVEKNLMQQPPRERNAGLFKPGELIISCLQGVVIATALLLLYHWYMTHEYPLPYVRTIVFVTLIISNVLLTFATRSFTETLPQTLRYENNLVFPILIISVSFLAVILLVPFVRDLFVLSPLHPSDFAICLASAFTAVLWFELYKAIRIKIPRFKQN